MNIPGASQESDARWIPTLRVIGAALIALVLTWTVTPAAGAPAAPAGRPDPGGELALPDLRSGLEFRYAPITRCSRLFRRDVHRSTQGRPPRRTVHGSRP